MKIGSFTTNLVHMTDSGKLAHKARLRRGLSQRELANGICSAAHISRLERGRCLASPGLLLQLAERLEVNMDKLVRSYLQSGPALSALAELAVGLTTEAQLNLARQVLDRACEQLSPEHASYQRDAANVYRARSYWHQVEGNMATAQHLARKRLEVVQQLRSNPFVRADAYYQVGSLALRERQLDQAEEHRGGPGTRFRGLTSTPHRSPGSAPRLSTMRGLGAGGGLSVQPRDDTCPHAV